MKFRGSLRQIFLNLTIRMKLIVLVCLALGLLLLSALSGYWGIGRGHSALEEIVRTRMASVMLLQTMREAETSLQANQVSVFMYESDTEAQSKFARLAALNQDTWARIDSAVAAYQKLPLDNEEKGRWATAMDDLVMWRNNDQKLIDIVKQLAANHDPDEQKGLFQDYFLLYSVAAPLYLKVESSLKAVLEKSVESAEHSSQRAFGDSALASYVIIGVTSAAFIALLFMSFLIMRAITKPIRTAIEAAAQIAEGNLEFDIKVSGRDEMGMMLESLASMQGQLRTLVGEIQAHSSEIGTTSSHLSHTTERIASAIRDQQAFTDDMALLVQQTTDSIGRIANHAADANRMAMDAGGTSATGERVIKSVATEIMTISDTVNAAAGKVKNLGEDTKEISTVITVIKEIAEQTNLLALNAAIEAARAGESGRGFAVVADEVRLLAERTAASTQQIAETINRIVAATDEVVATMETQVATVKRGVELADQAGIAVESINRETVRLVSTVDEISTTLEDQRKANTSVADTVDQVAGMSKTNSVAIHECAESAARLKDLASNLRNAMSRFRIS